MKMIFALLLLIPSLGWSACDQVLCRLTQAGAKCKESSAGNLCVLPPSSAYSQPIAVMVPKGVQQPQEVVLHLHGYLGVCDKTETSHRPDILNREYNLLGQLAEHGSNSIMVMPMSTFCEGYDQPTSCELSARCDTYSQELVPNFKKVLAHIEGVLHTAPDTDWQVTAHSGGGSIAARILSANPGFAKTVEGVGLLDATSCEKQIGGFWKRAMNNGKFKVRSRYTAKYGESASRVFASENRKFQSSSAQTGEHCEVPKKWFGRLIEMTDDQEFQGSESGEAGARH